MNDIGDKIENLKKQQEAAKELFVKCQGAIEFLESELKEQESSNKGKKK